MFTGIIQSKGEIESLEKSNSSMRLWINLGKLDVSAIQLGDSIAVNGACLTVVSLNESTALFDVSEVYM